MLSLWRRKFLNVLCFYTVTCTKQPLLFVSYVHIFSTIYSGGQGFKTMQPYMWCVRKPLVTEQYSHSRIERTQDRVPFISCIKHACIFWPTKLLRHKPSMAMLYLRNKQGCGRGQSQQHGSGPPQYCSFLIGPDPEPLIKVKGVKMGRIGYIYICIIMHNFV